MTLVPSPTTLLMSSVPRCRSTICLTMARPRPVPRFAAACVVGAVEALGQPGQVLARDAGAMVGHGQRSCAGSLGGDFDRRGGRRAAITHRIAEQIVDDLHQLRAVAADRRKVIGQLNDKVAALGFWRHPGIGDRCIDDIVERHALRRRQKTLGLDPRQAHQILDDPDHSPRFVANGRAKAQTRVGGRSRSSASVSA